MQVLGKWYLGLGLPEGKSKLRVPAALREETDKKLLTVNGLTRFEHVNPYALFDQMKKSGRVHYKLPPLEVLRRGQVDPLVEKGLVK